MKKHASILLKILNEEHGTSVSLKDFRSFSKYMDVETRDKFKTSPGFAIPDEKTVGLIFTHPYNKHLEGLVDTTLHEFKHIKEKNSDCNTAQQYANENTSKYINILKQLVV